MNMFSMILNLICNKKMNFILHIKSGFTRQKRLDGFKVKNILKYFSFYLKYLSFAFLGRL